VLRTHSGVAPVTKQSGKRRQVVMRHGCNPRLRHALDHMARVAMQRATHFSSVYVALRAKGQRHGQALRTIGDRLLRILMAMLRHRTCYDTSRIRCEPVVQIGQKISTIRQKANFPHDNGVPGLRVRGGDVSLSARGA
jgi:hypothetical protein